MGSSLGAAVEYPTCSKSEPGLCHPPQDVDGTVCGSASGRPGRRRTPCSPRDRSCRLSGAITASGMVACVENVLAMRVAGKGLCGSAELAFASHREVEDEVEPGSITWSSLHLHGRAHCLDQLAADR